MTPGMIDMALQRLRFGPSNVVATAIAVVTAGILWIFTRIHLRHIDLNFSSAREEPQFRLAL